MSIVEKVRRKLGSKIAGIPLEQPTPTGTSVTVRAAPGAQLEQVLADLNESQSAAALRTAADLLATGVAAVNSGIAGVEDVAGLYHRLCAAGGYLTPTMQAVTAHQAETKRQEEKEKNRGRFRRWRHNLDQFERRVRF